MINLLLAEPIDMPAPMGFSDWLTFWMVIVVSLVNAIALCLAGYRFLQVLQLANYRINGWFSWIKQDKGAYWGRLLILSFLSCAALLITNVLLDNFLVYKIMTWIGVVFYFVFVTIFVINQFSVTKKTPLVRTRRMNRLIGVLFVLIFASTIFMLNFTSVYIPYFYNGAIGLTPVMLPVFILLAYFITWPFEKFRAKRFLKKATNKLAGYPDLIKVGITGSYGKTSVKNILAAMLSEKYSVCASPYSYNTTLGITKTIDENLKASDQVLICEMGARYVGDIAEICDFVKPTIGILTGIGNQHLESFKTQENLVKTKLELAKSVAENGIMFVNGDNQPTLDAASQIEGEKVVSDLASTTNEVRVSSLKTTSAGSEFVLSVGEKNVRCKTALLGRHNVSNILLCATVATHLGVSIESIAHAIKKLTPVAHRLALVPSSNSLIIIDDAYNGSVEGAKAALEVLSSFDGQKFVITPGLVELGKDQFNSNFEFGKNLANVADYVIVSGLTNYEAIASGLAFAKFDDSRILRAGSNAQAVTIMTSLAKAGDVVLFENDLPDNYA